MTNEQDGIDTALEATRQLPDVPCPTCGGSSDPKYDGFDCCTEGTVPDPRRVAVEAVLVVPCDVEWYRGRWGLVLVATADTEDELAPLEEHPQACHHCFGRLDGHYPRCYDPAHPGAIAGELKELLPSHLLVDYQGDGKWSATYFPYDDRLEAAIQVSDEATSDSAALAVVTAAMPAPSEAPGGGACT